MKNTFKTLSIITILAIITLGMAACASLTIVSVDWDSLEGPEKTRQYIGISNQQVTVYANYKDESRREAAFFTVTHDRDRTGIQTVTVKVLGQEGAGTFQTEVMELTGIRIQRSPSKTSYTVGDKADLSGIRVTGSWRDLPDAEIPTYQVEVAGFDSSSAGNKNVTVNFKGKTATFPVTVTASTATTSTTTPAVTTPSTQQSGTQQTYRIGNTGPGGGIVFYDKGSFSNGWRYLEGSPVEMGSFLTWASSSEFEGTDIPTGTAIGTGKANTAAILSVDTKAPAAKACVDYRGGGYSDWFLPSRDELNEMYKARTHFKMDGGFYWSSSQSENFSKEAWNQRFDSSGSQYPRNKIDTRGLAFYVRAIRAF